MSDSLLFGFVVLPGVTLGLVYHPILARLSVALVSPYAKADVAKRISAAMIDGLLIGATLELYRNSELLIYLFLGGAYLLLRDAVAGRSVGKFFCGLVVINLESGRPCGRKASISRNALLLLPGANVVALFLEAATIVRDPQGQRLGDRLAWTQVVEGFGARDAVRAAQAWWLDFIGHLEGNPRARGRAPVRIPR
jgi:uncharacterized RDD family membrane protein YckC